MVALSVRRHLTPLEDFSRVAVVSVEKVEWAAKDGSNGRSGEEKTLDRNHFGRKEVSLI